MTDKKQHPNPSNPNKEYGEGNYKASREYQKGASESAGTEKSARAAQQAKQALEDPDTRRELEAAEREGKERAQAPQKRS